MEVTRVRVTIEGVSPLLLHSDKGANPLSVEAKSLKAVSSKRKKSEEDHFEMVRIEWMSGLYLDKSGRVAVPVENVRAAIRDGAKLSKLGKEISRKVFIDGTHMAIAYDGPRDLEKLFDDARFRDTRSVRVGQQRVMRTRPHFDKWALSFDAYWDSDSFDTDLFARCLESAGKFIGIGDFRPDKGGTFGRFKLASMEAA